MGERGESDVTPVTEHVQLGQGQEVVLGCENSCLGSGREENANYHVDNVFDSNSDREIRENIELDTEFDTDALPDFVRQDTSMTEEDIRDFFLMLGTVHRKSMLLCQLRVS